MNTLPRRLGAKPSVVHTVLDGEAVLLNVEDGVYFGLDGVGTQIWDLLVAGATEDEIVSQLQEEYDVEPAILRADIKAFLATLAVRGLTQERDG